MGRRQERSDDAPKVTVKDKEKLDKNFKPKMDEFKPRMQKAMTSAAISSGGNQEFQKALENLSRSVSGVSDPNPGPGPGMPKGPRFGPPGSGQRGN